MLQLWTVIEQVLQKDYMLNSPDEGKIQDTDIKVGQKVFLERRPEGLREEGELVSLHNTESHQTNDDECQQGCQHLDTKTQFALDQKFAFNFLYTQDFFWFIL